MRHTGRLATLLVVVIALVTPSARSWVGGAAAAHGVRSDADAITVETLAHGFPSNAPGRDVLLERITLAPGAELPTHSHPGTYVVLVESGELSVAIVEGFAEVTWAGQSTRQLVGPGEQVLLRAGDSVVEQQTLIHSGVNPGSTPVVLIAASLLTPGAPRLHSPGDPATPQPSWRPGERP